METAHTGVTLGQSPNSLEVDQPLFIQHCVKVAIRVLKEVKSSTFEELQSGWEEKSS